MSNLMSNLCIWANLTDCVIMVLSKTWLKSSATNNMIHIAGYTLTDRAKKGRVQNVIKMALNFTWIVNQF